MKVTSSHFINGTPNEIDRPRPLLRTRFVKCEDATLLGCCQYGDWGRDLALYLGRKRCGLKLRGLGAAVGGVDEASVGMAVTRFGERVAQAKELRECLEKADKMLNVGM